MQRRWYIVTVCLVSVFLIAIMWASLGAVDPAERNNAGIVSYEQGDFEAALLLFQVAQVNKPDESVPYLNAGLALARRGEWNESVLALEQALKTADLGLVAQIYYNLGNVYFQMRDFEQAVFAYQRALLLQPDDNDTRHNLELALQRILPPAATEIPDSLGGSPTPTSEAADQNSVEEAPLESLSRDEAEQLLDAAQRSQQSLSQGLPTPSAGETLNERDW